MAFTEQQSKHLTSKLSPKFIKTREANGKVLAYIEGWHAISEANRIFGFDGWDRETIAEKCVWSGKSGQHFACAYTAKVRISVRAGESVITREGSGSGEAKGLTPGQAHDMSLKAAETDATKRALATFGNPFGLALYDKELAGVRGGHRFFDEQAHEKLQAWSLHSESGQVIETLPSAKAFAEALSDRIQAAVTIEGLFGLWERNVRLIGSLSHGDKTHDRGTSAGELVTLLKSRAKELTGLAPENPEKQADSDTRRSANGALCAGISKTKIDKNSLQIGEPKRIRSKEHLKFVAKQPCLICGRRPSQAHHIRYAQPRALSRKVSDEFVVPLCTIHHDALHRVGDEKMWWNKHSIDPMAVAADLWTARSGRLQAR